MKKRFSNQPYASKRSACGAFFWGLFTLLLLGYGISTNELTLAIASGSVSAIAWLCVGYHCICSARNEFSYDAAFSVGYDATTVIALNKERLIRKKEYRQEIYPFRQPNHFFVIKSPKGGSMVQREKTFWPTLTEIPEEPSEQDARMSLPQPK